jgi:hypothetical protein
MRKKIVISMAVVALLLIGIMATSVLASDRTLTNNVIASNVSLAAAESATSKNHLPENVSPDPITAEDVPTSIVPNEVKDLPEVDLDNLRETVPTTYEETDARVFYQRTRFLLYTHDGKHVMWGFVGNGYFVGTDNLGKRCWGIYGKGVFAGFYSDEFFWGRYRNGNWKAEGLFGLNYSHGKYILFPTADITPAITATTP